MLDEKDQKQRQKENDSTGVAADPKELKIVQMDQHYSVDKSSKYFVHREPNYVPFDRSERQYCIDE